MDVRARTFRLPTPTLRHDAAHVRSDRPGVRSALWLATQVPPKTRSIKRRLRVSIWLFFFFCFFLHFPNPKLSVTRLVERVTPRFDRLRHTITSNAHVLTQPPERRPSQRLSALASTSAYRTCLSKLSHSPSIVSITPSAHST